MRGWVRLLLGVATVIAVVSGGGFAGTAQAQSCGSVNVECGERECIPTEGGGCTYTGNCLGGYGGGAEDCEGSGNNCRVPQVCAGYGYCTVAVYGSCGGGGGGGGGGGAYQFPTCGGTTELSCGNPANFISYIREDGEVGSWTVDTNLAKCMHRGGCGDHFPSQHEVTGCDNNEIKGICRDNCGCCEPGEEYKATVVEEGNYWKSVDCRATISILFCDDWDDVYTGERKYSVQSAGECYCSCPEDEDGNPGKCGAQCNKGGGSWVYNDRVKCQKRSTTWACQPICSATAPSNLTISQGSSETTANVSWNVGSGGSSQRLYVDQSSTEVDQSCPTAGACEVKATLAAGTNSYIVTGLAPATTYYFRVVTYKSSSCVAATRRSYTTPEQNNDITGRVYLDSANICGSSSGMAGVTLYLDGAAAGVSVEDGSYSLTATPGLHSVAVGVPGSYICSTGETCSAGCPTQNNVSAGEGSFPLGEP